MSRSIGPLVTVDHCENRIKTKPKMKLVVLDLNGILVDRVYIENRPPKDDADMYVTNSAGSKWEVYFKKDVHEFLEYVFSNFAVGVWTSGQLENVKPITDKLFEGYPLEFLYTQEHCTRMGHDGKKPIFIKDVHKIQRFDPEDVLFIDDDGYKLKYNYPAIHTCLTDLKDVKQFLELWKKAGGVFENFQIPFDFRVNMSFYLDKIWRTNEFWSSVTGIGRTLIYFLYKS